MLAALVQVIIIMHIMGYMHKRKRLYVHITLIVLQFTLKPGAQ